MVSFRLIQKTLALSQLYHKLDFPILCGWVGILFGCNSTLQFKDYPNYLKTELNMILSLQFSHENFLPPNLFGWNFLQPPKTIYYIKKKKKTIYMYFLSYDILISYMISLNNRQSLPTKLVIG